MSESQKIQKFEFPTIATFCVNKDNGTFDGKKSSLWKKGVFGFWCSMAFRWSKFSFRK